ncbi:MAG: Pyrrolo-quinoline quinone [Verrucomicrobiales bacterium]|nr:Pyrrolo-quinoline quinone [Verrucomicrobiales bacterium]
MNHFRKYWIAIALFASFSCLADWPQWRGPDRTGRISSTEVIIEKLPSAVTPAWKFAIGEGFSSPVVSGDALIYSDNQGGKETLHCLTAADGKEIWKFDVDDTFKDQQGPPGPRCTPLISSGLVFVQSCKGEFQARKLKDGALVWRVNFKDFGAKFIGEKGNTPGANRHGNNGSPAVDDKNVYVLVGGTNDQGVVCFDKASGKQVWHSLADLPAYAAPFIASIDGTKQLVCFLVDGPVGLDLGTGKELWRIPVKTDYARHAMTPVVYQNMVVLGSHQVGLLGISLKHEGDKWLSSVAWTNKPAAPNFSSMVEVDGYVYGLGPAKNLVCVEIKSGKLMWSEDNFISTSADKGAAAFLVSGPNILSLADGGELLLFKASSEKYIQLSRVQATGLNWCNPAYSKGFLYLRNGVRGTGELMAIQVQP